MDRDRTSHSAHSLTAPTPTRSTCSTHPLPFPGRHAHPPTLSFTLHATRVGPLGAWLSALITPGERAVSASVAFLKHRTHLISTN